MQHGQSERKLGGPETITKLRAGELEDAVQIVGGLSVDVDQGPEETQISKLNGIIIF